MCHITFLTHTCGHPSSPPPKQCTIYTTYYSEHSVLDLASALIPNAHECPFAFCHERRSASKCHTCIVARRQELRCDPGMTFLICEGESDSDSNSPVGSESSKSSATSVYSDVDTLKLLEAEACVGTGTQKALPPIPPPASVELGILKVVKWEGWGRMNRWQKKVVRGGFGGEKVRRKVVRSSISDTYLV